MLRCDQCAVQDLAARFTDAVNRGDPGQLAALFTEDGEWLVPGAPPAVGRAAISQQLARVLAGHSRLLQFLHAGQVDFSPPDAAAATWYASEELVDLAGSRITMHGSYRDALAATAAGWRFRRREFTLLRRSTERDKWYPAAANRAQEQS